MDKEELENILLMAFIYGVRNDVKAFKKMMEEYGYSTTTGDTHA